MSKEPAPDLDVWDLLLTLAAADIGKTKEEAIAGVAAGTVALCVRFFDLTKDIFPSETTVPLEPPVSDDPSPESETKS